MNAALTGLPAGVRRIHPGGFVRVNPAFALYQREIQSVFPSIAATIAHMYVVNSVWLWAMSGVSTDHPGVPTDDAIYLYGVETNAQR